MIFTRFSMAAALGVLLSSTALATALHYPDTPRGAVMDDYFGTKVPDPYRWLEDVDTPETLSWVKAQQALTTPILNALPERAHLQARLKELMNYERHSAPEIVRDSQFFLKNDGLQNQAVLFVKTDGKPARALIDPNLLSAEGTTALTQFKPSPNGSKLAYLLAEAGSDWETLHILDTATGTDHADALTRVKFSALAWTEDEQAVLYSKFPEAAAGNAKGTFESLSHHSLYLHRLGTPQADDALIYAPEDAAWTVNGQISKDGRYAIVTVNKGATEDNRLSIYELGDANKPARDTVPAVGSTGSDIESLPAPGQRPVGAGAGRSGASRAHCCANPVSAPVFGGKPVAIIGADFGSAYKVVGNVGNTFFVLTTQGAPRKRLVAIDLARPDSKNWRTVVAEGRDVILSAHHISGRLLVQTLHDAAAQLSRYSLTGKKLGTVALPGIGDVSDITGEPDQFLAYFQFTGFARPAATYRLGMKSGDLVLDWAPKLPFEPADYITEQVFYSSRDGTRVPMFISYKKGLKKNGSNPTLLYGYGGFNIALTPTYSSQNLAWMEMGGVYAQPNLRGGSEYGEAWHVAGTRERKQNVFNDFASAAEYLIASRYTSAKHLGIYGRSNGGLLVGATLNQHPELFAAAVPGVGVMDMLRFHLPSFTIGHAWRDDYGSAETAEGFSYLYPYSPLHNVTPGVNYPPTLTITADHDDRVVPGHSFKYAATMQWANADNPNPQLIRIEEKGGHGAGKPVGKKIEEVADVLAFLRHYTQ